ncbi:DNA topoisomerase 3-alpha [Blattella germanica]|nr:DNA topoisomerase 3-alpha [Blattella germanica]
MQTSLCIGYRFFHGRNVSILCKEVDSFSGDLKMKVLNVAEKNDAAKNLAGFLSGGNLRRRDGYSKFNKIYEFECNAFNQRCHMIMTSVSGHLLGLEFVGNYRNWRGCNPLALFDAPVTKSCPADYQPIKRTLEKEVRQAKFSEITARSAYRALQTLVEPNRNISNAVDVRQELDLRIGAAFTRFQTLRLQQVFPQNLSESLISYGSCQFPTLGFVVERFNAIRNFIPEQFWKIKGEQKQFHVTECILEMEKLGSRKLRMNAKEIMKVAEKLYTQGFISYPRTETNIFPKELNLQNLSVSFSGNEQKVYEFVVRHFLACCSKDAEGLETIVEIDINNEKFLANGLMIIARNYLEVYPYEKWNAKEIHIYENGQTFEPTSVEMTDGETNPPKLLTEADLISLMEKHGIGYDNMGFPMSKPHLRAELEADLKKICEGIKDPKLVLEEQLARYKEVFRIALEQAAKIDEALAQYLEETAQQLTEQQISEQVVCIPVMKCSSCGLDMVLRSRREGSGKFVSCMGFPDCRNSVWFSSNVEEVETSNESCTECGPHVRQLKFKFRRGSMAPFYPDHYTGCIAGCDPQFLDVLGIRFKSVRGMFTSSDNTNWNPTTANNNRNSHDNAIVCNCGEDAVLLTVRKDGPNKGRPFYKCGKPQGEGCNYFMWGDNENSPPLMNNRNDNERNSTSNNYQNTWSLQATNEDGRSETDVNCSCGVPAKRLTVHKDGPNKGRLFYTCSKPQNGRCNFFKWADDVVHDGSGNGGGPGGGGGGGGYGGGTTWTASSRGRGAGTKRPASSSTGPPKKRKCSICKEEGHTKTTCPNK